VELTAVEVRSPGDNTSFLPSQPRSAPDDQTLEGSAVAPRAPGLLSASDTTLLKPSSGPIPRPTAIPRAEPTRPPALATDATLDNPTSPPTGSPGDTLVKPTAGPGPRAVGEPPRPGIDNYKLLSVLGRGGMGVVYKAQHLKLGRTVALKMILAGAHAGKNELARFQAEAEAVASLQHPNIVQIYEIGDNNGQPYFALEYVDGGSLQQRLNGNPLTAKEAAQLLMTLARAVDYAHQRGIVHRDLKPANVLLQKPEIRDQKSEVRSQKPEVRGQKSEIEGQLGQIDSGLFTPDLCPKITDFGLAKRLDSDSGQTGTGDILGTPSYMAPEQASGQTRAIGPPADIYALGAILYDLLTGVPPFRGATVLDTLLQVKGREPLPPTRLQPKVPRDLETICLKCLQKEPTKRYGSAGALADDLQRYLENKPILARPTPLWERVVKWARRRPAVAALLAALAIVVTGSFFGMLALWLQAEQERQDAVMARDAAQEQEAAAIKARDEAERQRKAAVEATQEATRQHTRAEKNLNQAFDAGQKLLTRISEERLLKEPQMEGLRRALLKEARQYYESFQDTEGGTPQVRFQAARAHHRVGVIFHKLDQYAEAQSAYVKAIALLEGLTREAPGKSDYRRELARTRLNLGVALQATDQPRQAEREYKEALGLLTELRRDFPGAEEDERELAAAYDSLAGLLQRDPARAGEAEGTYQQALDRLRKLQRDFTKHRQNRDFRAQLARTLTNFGTFLLATKPGEAEKAFAEAVSLLTELAGEEKDNPDYAGLRGVALINLAVLWEPGQPVKAEETYLDVTAVFDRLVQDFPRVTEYRHNLARAWTNLSVMQARDSKRLAAAAASRANALPHWRRLVQLMPKIADYHNGLIGVLSEDARYLLRQNAREQAVEVGTEAVRLRKVQVEAFPDRPEFKVALAVNLVDLGQLYGFGKETSKEEEQYLEAVEVLESITQKPRPRGWAEVMADAHFNLGGLRWEQLDYPGTLSQVQKAMLYQREAVADGGDAKAREKLARYSLQVVMLQVKLKDHAAATATAAEVEPTLRDRKIVKGADLLTLAQYVALCIPLAEGDTQKRYADQAVRLLQAAVDQGYRNAKAVRDPVFAPLRGRTDYDELVKGLEK
jgi:serine/threonine-protein kinase